MRGVRNYLVYAVVLGAFAAGGAAWYVSNAEAAANPTESVVVARVGIPARVALTEDFLTIQKVPKGAVHPDAANSMEPFIGKTTKQSIAPGEQILATKVFHDRTESGAAFVLPEGHRAVAINASELIAAGGLILPGDKVDVIGSCVVPDKPDKADTDTSSAAQVSSSTPAAQTSRARVVYALQKLEVLAVAQDIVGDQAATLQGALRPQDSVGGLSQTRTADVRPAAKTITLALTPGQSEKLISLETHPSCSVRLALRAADDDSNAPITVLDFNPSGSMDAVVQPQADTQPAQQVKA